jgi:predicted aspartyl protease
MNSIRLKILEIEDVELKYKRIEPYLFTRIYVTVIYKTKDNSMMYEQGLVDTGAIVSVLPKRVWEKLIINFVADHHVKGVVKKEECTLPVKIGFVKTKLIDELRNQTPTFTSLVYCAESNDVPVIFGMKDALDKFKLEIDTRKKQGHLILTLPPPSPSPQL